MLLAWLKFGSGVGARLPGTTLFVGFLFLWGYYLAGHLYRDLVGLAPEEGEGTRLIPTNASVLSAANILGRTYVARRSLRSRRRLLEIRT